jgi:DNA-binding CsgD family transcriptional regulator
MGTQQPDDGAWAARFQEAALDPRQWLPALQSLADATGSARAELVGFGGPETARFNWVTSIDARILDEFVQIEAYLPAINFRIAADGGAGVLNVVHEAHYDRARRTLRRDDYADFCEQYEMQFGCQTALLRESGGLVGLSVLRSRADGRTDERARGIFAQAAQGARLAVRMQRAIEDQGFNLLTGTLEAMSLACFLFDGLGQVRAMTPSAERLVAAPALLRLADNRLSSSSAEDRRRIDLALRSVLGSAAIGHVRLPLYRTRPLPELVLDLFRLPAREWATPFAPRALAIARDPTASLKGRESVVAGAFGLTPAETELALGLAEGRTRETIAAARGISMETLRAQLKSVYQKTGCGRESELVLLIKALTG